MAALLVRMDDGLKDRLEVAAKGAGCSQNRLVVAAVEAWLSEPREVPPEPDITPAVEGKCYHPKGSEKKLGYGVFCGECNRRLR